MFSLLIALFFIQSFSASAEELNSSPGWTLTKNAEAGEEENTYQSGPVFFTLRPPDGRPPISIDYKMAQRLRNGEVAAEAIYSGQAQAEKNKEEENSWGNHSLAVAEPVNSSLTREDGRKLDAQGFEVAKRVSSEKESSLGATNFGFQTSSGRSGSRIPAASSRNNTAASSPRLGIAKPSESLAQPVKSIADDPRVAVAAENRAPADAGKKFAGGVNVNNSANNFGTAEKAKEGEGFKVAWPGGEPGSEGGPALPQCEADKPRIFDTPTLERLTLPPGCFNVRVRAWGAGGGSGRSVDADGNSSSADGGGGAYVFTEGPVDISKHELVVVVGSAGGDASNGDPGKPGFLSGGKGGSGSEGSGVSGGGGGGYSGLFLVDKARFKDGEKPQLADMAIAIAAGGGGGSGDGSPGGSGGIERGGGIHGATQVIGGTAGGGSSRRGLALQGGDAGVAGGGGGGGYFGGGGGGRDAESGAFGGGGGTSFWRFKKDGSTGLRAEGNTAGNADFKPRGKAGNAGKAGLVILEFY